MLKTDPSAFSANSRMKFPPAVWGPIFWMTIHITALGYSEKPTYAEKRAAKEFFEGLQFLLPCAVCREHYREHLTAKPVTPFLDNRRDLFSWTVALHNAVNVKLNKPIFTETEALFYIKRLGARGKNPLWSYQDMQEVDSGSFMRGVLLATVAGGVLGAGLWFWNK